MDFAKLFSEYGFNGIVIGTLFFILWRMLVWVMKWVDKINDQHIKERESWKEIQDKQNQTLDRICASISRHDEKAEERGKFVRDEHREMIQSLGRINGYKTG